VRSRAAEPNNKAWAAILACAAVAAAALACVAVVAVGAGKANAAPTPTRATIEATQFTVPERQTGEEFAVCKGNKRAVGGGVVQSGEAAVGMTVIASGPLDASGVTLQTKDGDIAKQWYATVNNFTAQQRTYRVFAICSSTSKATIEATQLSVPGGQVGEEFAVCPGTKRALGGGAVQSGPGNTALTLGANGPLDASGVTLQTVTGDVAKQWYATVNNFTNEQRTYRVFAICSGGSDATIKATPLFTVLSGDTVERFAVCPAKKRALGGGIVQSGEVAGTAFYERANGPLDSSGVTLQTNDGDTAKQWYAAQRNSSGTDQRFKLMAICGT
jgi:hypothetical protein